MRNNSLEFPVCRKAKAGGDFLSKIGVSQLIARIIFHKFVIPLVRSYPLYHIYFSKNTLLTFLTPGKNKLKSSTLKIWYFYMICSMLPLCEILRLSVLQLLDRRGGV